MLEWHAHSALQVRDKLYTTRELLYYCLNHPHEHVLDTLTRGGGYTDSVELMATLQLLHRSLIETKDDSIANGPVLNAIRQVRRAACFCCSCSPCIYAHGHGGSAVQNGRARLHAQHSMHMYWLACRSSLEAHVLGRMCAFVFVPTLCLRLFVASAPVRLQVQTFGSAMMQLDIRQESTRHRDVMNAITEHLELGSFNSWPEEEKLKFLEKELQARHGESGFPDESGRQCHCSAPNLVF